MRRATYRRRSQEDMFKNEITSCIDPCKSKMCVDKPQCSVLQSTAVEML